MSYSICINCERMVPQYEKYCPGDTCWQCGASSPLPTPPNDGCSSETCKRGNRRGREGDEMSEEWRCDHGKQADDYCELCERRESDLKPKLGTCENSHGLDSFFPHAKFPWCVNWREQPAQGEHESEPVQAGGAREFYERTKKGNWEVYRWDHDSAVFRFADAYADERVRLAGKVLPDHVLREKVKCLLAELAELRQERDGWKGLHEDAFNKWDQAAKQRDKERSASERAEQERDALKIGFVGEHKDRVKEREARERAESALRTAREALGNMVYRICDELTRTCIICERPVDDHEDDCPVPAALLALKSGESTEKK